MTENQRFGAVGLGSFLMGAALVSDAHIAVSLTVLAVGAVLQSLGWWDSLK